MAEHLALVHNSISSDVFNSNFSFSILEISPRELDIAEQKWVDKIVTMRLFGLNKEKPWDVTDSVISMCRKSLGLITQ